MLQALPLEEDEFQQYWEFQCHLWTYSQNIQSWHPESWEEEENSRDAKVCCQMLMEKTETSRKWRSKSNWWNHLLMLLKWWEKNDWPAFKVRLKVCFKVRLKVCFKVRLQGLLPVNWVDNTNLFVCTVNKFLNDIILWTTYKQCGSFSDRQLSYKSSVWLSS